jgi:hypothetical protein
VGLSIDDTDRIPPGTRSVGSITKAPVIHAGRGAALKGWETGVDFGLVGENNLPSSEGCFALCFLLTPFPWWERGEEDGVRREILTKLLD